MKVLACSGRSNLAAFFSESNRHLPDRPCFGIYSTVLRVHKKSYTVLSKVFGLQRWTVLYYQVQYCTEVRVKYAHFSDKFVKQTKSVSS
jgi:hypothetical protein